MTQLHVFFYAEAASSIADTVCGYAALTMIPEDMEVLPVGFKINFMKPAKWDMLTAIGKVLQSGRTLTICESYVYDRSHKN